jgi:hypothetical protein
MFKFTSEFQDQPVYPVDTMYEIDQAKLVQWLKHMRDLNMLIMNDLQRDDVERAKAKGAFDAYSCLLGDIQRGTIFMKK